METRNEFEESELFECAFQAYADGILVIDRAGVILRTNPSLVAILGLEKVDLLNSSMEHLFPSIWAQIQENNILESSNTSFPAIKACRSMS